MPNVSLKQICEERNTSLAELGRKVGKSKQYMSELARGNIRLTYDMAIRIAAALNTTPDNLFLPQSNFNRQKQEPPTAQGG